MKHMFEKLNRLFLSTVTTLRRRWKIVALVSVLLVGAGFFFWRKQQKQATTITVVSPSVETIMQSIDISGVVDAKEKASLNFVAGGKVTYLGAKEGDGVKKWQTLARIDAQLLKNQLEQGLNSYFNQRMTFEQQKENIKDTALTNALNRTQQQSQKTLENSVLGVEYQQIAINNTALSAPFSGVLVSAPTSVVGDILSAADAFVVVNPSSLVFRAEVDQADIATIQKGLKANIVLDAYQDQTIQTTVSYISYQTVQSATGSVYIVEFSLPTQAFTQPLDHYRLGMNGDVQIIIKEKAQALTIPVDAIKDRDGKSWITIQHQDGKTEERQVSLGIANDQRAEVLSGIQASDAVVVP